MPKRKRYKDTYKVGKSSLVPFVGNEAWQDRHARRKDEAMKNENEVRSWCNNHKWQFYIKNNGHHWIFITHEKKVIEWWPSSGKLAIGKQYKKGVHTHDYLQLLQVLEMTL